MELTQDEFRMCRRVAERFRRKDYYRRRDADDWRSMCFVAALEKKSKGVALSQSVIRNGVVDALRVEDGRGPCNVKRKARVFRFSELRGSKTGNAQKKETPFESLSRDDGIERVDLADEIENALRYVETISEKRNVEIFRRRYLKEETLDALSAEYRLNRSYCSAICRRVFCCFEKILCRSLKG